MLKKLRFKFVCINMTIVTAMLIIILGLVLYFTGQNLERENIQMMQAVATMPSQPGKPDDLPENVRLPYFTLKLSNSGELISTSGSYYDLSDKHFLQQLITLSDSEKGQTGLIKEYNLRYCRIDTPTSHFLVFSDISSEITAMNSLAKNCVLIGIAGFFAFLIISILLAKWAVKPVEKAWGQQKQFVADASHELKTPLTVILTNAELLCSSPCTPDETSRFSENIRTTAGKMRILVENLLDLARADNGTAGKNRTVLHFCDIIGESVELYEPLFFEHGLELICEADERVYVKGISSQLKQIPDILLDNALKYAASGSQIRVTLRRHGFHCILSVASKGDPIAPDDLKNIFKRFYRIDKIRNSRGSYGLGLSIAESIVHDHNGKIWAESSAGINTFFIRLTCVPAPYDFSFHEA